MVVFCKTQSKAIAVARGEYLQISFMPHCFCSRIIWQERKLTFDSILISSLLLLYLFCSENQDRQFQSIKTLILKRDFLEITVRIWDKQFLVYQTLFLNHSQVPHLQCKLISQYIFVFLSLIEDMFVLCIYSTLAKRAKTC